MMKKTESHPRGFTLIELLVVIAIIGILVSIAIPSYNGIIDWAHATDTEGRFAKWGGALSRYHDENGYFPPFLLDEDEGVPVVLSPEHDEDHDSFVAALTGRKWNTTTKLWDNKLEGALKKQKGKSAYIDQMTEDFGSNGYLADGWGGTKIHVLVQKDYASNGRGKDTIELSSSALSEIKDALSGDYDMETINSVEDQLKMIPKPYAFYVLQDDETGTGNVFSWDITNILNNAEQ
jgi:prepilin-type N-terminal cleavage/methylation domain-containing protein